MYKHKFNIFPVMTAEEIEKLTADMQEHGFDPSQPIVLYEGQVLDGWNRLMTAEMLKIEPVFREFEGDDFEAVNFVMRTNKRRNLTSQQWATIAVEADDIIHVIAEQVEKQRRSKQAAKLAKTHMDGEFGVSDNNLSQTRTTEDFHGNSTSEKVAEMFNTNRTYVNEAKKLKETDPEQFEKVKSGEISLKKAKKSAEKLPEITVPETTLLAHPHLNNLKFHGNQISEAAKVLKQKMDEYDTYLYLAKFKAQKFARRLHTTATRDVVDDIFLSSKSLKWLEICPVCTGEGCDKCESTGLMEAQTAAAFKR